MLQKILPSYVYSQFSDDDDIQAFKDAYNTLAQQYLDWDIQINLPVYTGPLIVGLLLDWVALGLYGMKRPVLPFGIAAKAGPYNTFAYNTLPYNAIEAPKNVHPFVTSDDVFKRCMTWALYKGDGKVFDIRWLKRRVARFLFGVNGTDPPVDQTYRISVTFGTDNQVDINILSGFGSLINGAVYNGFAYNTQRYNGRLTHFSPLIPIPLAPVFKAAMDAGVLETPFQFKFVVGI